MKQSVFISLIIFSGFFITSQHNTSFAQGPDTLWTKLYGGNNFENAFGIDLTEDNGYIIIGSTKTYGAGDHDAYLIKTDELGNQQWYKTFGGSEEDRGFRVFQTSDGGYIFAGETWSFGAGIADAWVIRTDADGNELWSNTYGGSDYDRANDMVLLPDGSFVFLGQTFSWGAGIDDFYLVKADSDGNELWHKTYGGANSEEGHSVKQTADGGFILAGTTDSYGAGNTDVYIVKTDAEGNEEWSNHFGTVEWDYAYDIIHTSDSGYLIAGHTWSLQAGQGYDSYVIKTDNNGVEEWIKQYPGEDSEYSHKIHDIFGYGYVISGYSYVIYNGSYDYFLYEIDKDGNRLWAREYGGNGKDFSKNSIATNDGGVALIGRTESFGAEDSDVWLVKTEDVITGIDQAVPAPEKIICQNSPNPFSEQTTLHYIVRQSGKVQLAVYNLLGQEIITLVNDQLQKGTYSVDFYANGLPAGLYIYEFTLDGMKAGSGKMIISQ